jgi:hypothetical protein
MRSGDQSSRDLLGPEAYTWIQGVPVPGVSQLDPRKQKPGPGSSNEGLGS